MKDIDKSIQSLKISEMKKYILPLPAEALNNKRGAVPTPG